MSAWAHKVAKSANAALQADAVPADAAKAEKQAAYSRHEGEIKQAEMVSMCLNTIGGGLGLVFFGSIANLLGRKGAFILYHAGGLVAAVRRELVAWREALAEVVAQDREVCGQSIVVREVVGARGDPLEAEVKRGCLRAFEGVKTKIFFA